MKDTLYTGTDCIRSMYDGKESNEGKVLIIKPEKLTDEYRKPEYQLFRASSGFGCSPTASGNAVFGSFCIDGEKTRFERFEFIGVANESAVEHAEELESTYTIVDTTNSEESSM